MKNKGLKFSLINCFIFLFCTTLYSQNSYLDSILKLEDKLDKKVFLNTILNLPYDKKTSDINKFLILAEKAKDIATDKNSKPHLAQAYENLALAYHFKSDFDLAIAYTLKEATTHKQLKNYKKYGNSYIELGWKMKRYNLDKSLNYMIKGIKIIEEYDNKKSKLLIAGYNNYGVLKQFIQEKDSALYYHKKSLNLCKYYNDSIGIPYALVHIAEVYRDRKQFTKAKKLLDEALFIRKKKNDIYGITDCYEHLGDYYFEKKEYEKSIKANKVAYLMSKKYSFYTISRGTTNKLYKSYEAIGDYKNALQMFKLNKKLLDSVSGENIQSKINQLEIQFNTAEKENELLTAALKINTQKYLILGLLGGLTLLVLASYSLIQRNRRKHQLDIIKEKEAGLRAIIQAEENERSKIARELHDGIVQQIGSVILNSRTIFEKMNLLDKPESQKLLKNLEDSNQDIRNISHQMMPRALEELGLVAALEDLLNTSLPIKGIQVNFEHFNITERLPQKIEKTLYRIVQELINNIIKHSNATQVSVQLFQTNNHTMLIVEDNGVGMKQQKSKGIGLLNINSRLNMVSGTVNYAPSPQSGTLVTVKIPVS